MGRAPKPAISAVVFTIVCACEAPLKFNEPPADTYTVGAREMKIGDDDISLQGATVTPGFFAATGIQPFLGRFVIDADEGGSAPAVAVLSHDLWAERFGSSPGIIGRQIELDGRQFTVVGVAPPGFRFRGAALLWTSQDRGAP